MKKKNNPVLLMLILSCFLLASCGKQMPSPGEASSSSEENLSEITAQEQENEDRSSIENYTKYADYEPVKAEPAALVPGENNHILVAYFSRAGNTYIPDDADAVSSASLAIDGDGTAAGNAEQIARWIAEETGGDLFLIQTEYTYPVDYDQMVEVGEGQDTDGYRPALVSHIEHMDQFDTVYLVYPIWHYTLSVPICSFLDEYDLSGKTVYAFAANAGSRFADSIEKIEDAQTDAVVVEGVSVSQNEMETAKETVLQRVRELTADDNKPKNEEETGEQTEMKMNVQVGEYSFTATLENNAAVEELLDMMEEGPVIIQMDDYLGFEKVGPLGRSLTTSNSQTTASAGDIVLYNGNNIVMFYGSNSWSYTRIGKIDDLADWKKALGSGSITAVFTPAG